MTNRTIPHVDPNPSGLCICGCGLPTTVANNPGGRYRKGDHYCYIAGHRPYKSLTGDGPNPSGMCMCGCGLKAPLAVQGNRQRGWVLGKPIRFIAGHGRKMSPVDFIEEDCGYDTPCWVWQRGITRAGYGLTFDGSRTRSAHIVYYIRLVGPVPEGLQLDHLCRNRACVNPSHLEPVTASENVRRGVMTKLTPIQVADILARTDEPLGSVAADYGVTKQNVARIWKREIWKDVEPRLAWLQAAGETEAPKVPKSGTGVEA